MMHASSKILVAVLLIAVAVVALPLALKKESKQPKAMQLKVVELKRRSFTIDVQSSGQLDAARTTLIASTIKGDQSKIIDLIADGASVDAGDLLVRLDPTPFEGKIQEIEAKITESKAHVEAADAQFEWEEQQALQEKRSLEHELCSAQLEYQKVVEGDGPLESSKLKSALVKAEKKYGDVKAFENDLEDLEKKGFLNPGERKQAEKKLAEEKETFEVAKLQYNSYTRRILPMLEQKASLQLKRAEVKFQDGMKNSAYKIAKANLVLSQAERNLEAFEGQLKAAEKELSATEIRAPFQGLAVLKEGYRSGENRRARIGDICLKNQPILDLPDLSSMKVLTRVREVDLHKIALGMEASITVDAFPALKLKGAVSQIGILGQSDRRTHERYFGVQLKIVNSDPRLRPGMTAQICIHSAKKEDVLSVPTHALFFEKGDPFVYVGQKKVPVTIGCFNEQYVELLDENMKPCLVSLVEP